MRSSGLGPGEPLAACQSRGLPIPATECAVKCSRRSSSAVATSRAGQGDADGRRLSLPSQLDRLINLHSDGLFGVTLRTHGNRKQAARRHLGAARARTHPLIEEKSIPRNAIADGANSAATCASAQGNHLGIADKEATTPTHGTHADSLAHE